MNRAELALEKQKQGYNCAQAVLCAFADVLNIPEDQLFRISEAFGGGMGGTQGMCGAVSSMVALSGLFLSGGIENLPETTKAKSYAAAASLMREFEEKIGTTECGRIKSEGLRSCPGCVEDAVRIVEKAFGL